MTVCLQICHYLFTSMCVNWITSLIRGKELNNPLQIPCCLVCLYSLERTPPATNEIKEHKPKYYALDLVMDKTDQLINEKGFWETAVRVTCMHQVTHFLHNSLCRCQRNLNSSPITGKLSESNVSVNEGWMFLKSLFPSANS